MSLLKSLIAPCAAVGTVCAILASAAPSKAATWDLCLPFAGGEVCGNYSSAFDEVYAYLPGLGTENMTIQCTGGGYEFTSKGQWSQAEVESFVSSYCEARGWYTH